MRTFPFVKGCVNEVVTKIKQQTAAVLCYLMGTVIYQLARYHRRLLRLVLISTHVLRATTYREFHSRLHHSK